MAWAGHEIVSDYVDDMWDFFQRPGPDEAELQPMTGVTLGNNKLRGGALWAEEKGINGRR